MPSFDIVSEVNQVEVHNAVDQCNKEVSTRFDFKGSDSRIEQAELTLTVYADDDFKLKQVVEVKNGIETEKSKSLVKLLKDSKMKVQASIQGPAVRVSGAKKDDLQAAIQLLRKSITDIPLQFGNFRD
jgi:uncharacterized protein YajQ (UPF0234 family)